MVDANNEVWIPITTMNEIIVAPNSDVATLESIESTVIEVPEDDVTAISSVMEVDKDGKEDDEPLPINLMVHLCRQRECSRHNEP